MFASTVLGSPRQPSDVAPAHTPPALPFCAGCPSCQAYLAPSFLQTHIFSIKGTTKSAKSVRRRLPPALLPRRNAGLTCSRDHSTRGPLWPHIDRRRLPPALPPCRNVGSVCPRCLSCAACGRRALGGVGGGRPVQTRWARTTAKQTPTRPPPTGRRQRRRHPAARLRLGAARCQGAHQSERFLDGHEGRFVQRVKAIAALVVVDGLYF